MLGSSIDKFKGIVKRNLLEKSVEGAVFQWLAKIPLKNEHGLGKLNVG